MKGADDIVINVLNLSVKNIERKGLLFGKKLGEGT